MKPSVIRTLACVRCSNAFVGHYATRYCGEVCRLATKKEQHRNWRERTLPTEPHKVKAQRKKLESRLADFGLTLDEYDDLLQVQEHRCAICREAFVFDRSYHARRPCLDHDHATGAFRGVICQTCNRAIGLLGDTYESINAALTYLARHYSGR